MHLRQVFRLIDERREKTNISSSMEMRRGIPQSHFLEEFLLLLNMPLKEKIRKKLDIPEQAAWARPIQPIYVFLDGPYSLQAAVQVNGWCGIGQLGPDPYSVLVLSQKNTTRNLYEEALGTKQNYYNQIVLLINGPDDGPGQ